MSKRCKACGIKKDISEYYKAGAYLQPLCIGCHNRKRCELHANTYVKRNKPKGFLALPVEEQQKIKGMLNQGMTLAAISNIYKDTPFKQVYSVNLSLWRKKGDLADPPELNV
jgi:hypothetical protein